MEKPTDKRFKDLEGQTFNNLFVKEYFGKKSKQPHWICECTCGKETIVCSGNLKNGKTKSCGCLRETQQKITNLTRQVFGMYTVIEYAGEAWPEKKRNRGHQWKCLCECGEERIVFGNSLKTGRSTGCGCIRNKHRLIDLKGKKFGKLTVLSYSGVKNKQPFWLCECECGIQKEIMGCNLREGKSKSCGCMSGGVIHGLFGKKGYKKYLLSDPIKRIRHNVGIAVKNALKDRYSSKNGGITFDNLSYTPKELKDHLESQFENWMSWDNYGGRMNDPKKTWHIDHIIPQCEFKYTALEDKLFKECWALSNLRPLEKIANIKKGNKIIVDSK